MKVYLIKSHGLTPGSKVQVPSLKARICSSDQEIAHLVEYGDSLSRSQCFGTGPPVWATLIASVSLHAISVTCILMLSFHLRRCLPRCPNLSDFPIQFIMHCMLKSTNYETLQRVSFPSFRLLRSDCSLQPAVLKQCAILSFCVCLLLYWTP